MKSIEITITGILVSLLVGSVMGPWAFLLTGLVTCVIVAYVEMEDKDSNHEEYEE